MGDLVERDAVLKAISHHISYYDDHYMHCLTKCIPEEIMKLPAATPSVSAAIAEVERLRDEWDRQMGDATGNDYSELAWRVETADEIVRALRALPPDARAVDGDLGVTPEVAEKLLRIREALAHDDIHEAWHWLYKIADSQVESLTPWAKLEACAAAITATNKGVDQ